MRAIVKYRSGDGFVDLKEAPIPMIGADEVLVKVRVAGICGSDIHILHDEFLNYPPVIMGHEFAGQIVKMGKAVTGWEEGNRVVSEPHTGSCGLCWLCRTGNPQICPKKRPIGSGTNGAFAEFIKVPAWLLHRIPEGVSFEEASLTEPTAICIHCVLETMRIAVGDFVAVLGPGPIGLLTAQLVREAGAGHVLIAGRSRDADLRLKVAKKLGVQYLVNVDEEDLASEIENLTPREGADVVVEASGSPEAINQAFQIVRRGGKICALGMTKKRKVEVPWNIGIVKGIQVVLPFSSGYTSWERALALIASQRIDVRSLITHRFSLEDWSNAFSLVEKGQAIKALLIP
ncbi:MAG: zinc-binding dehydrogenase [bacterium]